MTTPPQIFDEALRARRQARATEHLFHARAADELSDRLDEVNRTFPRVAVTGHAAPVWRDALAGHPKLGEIEEIPEGPVLAFGSGGFDLVIHALWLHWANDPVGALVQGRLALKPDGLMMAAMFGGLTLWELRAALAEAEAEVTGGLSPRVAPMGEIRDLGALLQRAGLAMPVADSDRVTLHYRDITHLMRDLRAMGETNVLCDRLRRPTRRAVFRRAGEIYAQAHAGADGRIPASFETVWLTGWAPGPDQPEPKRPGSATTRLADALGTREHSAGEKTGR
jgi:SAM-dependent methyltransferase